MGGEGGEGKIRGRMRGIIGRIIVERIKGGRGGRIKRWVKERIRGRKRE